MSWSSDRMPKTLRAAIAVAGIQDSSAGSSPLIRPEASCATPAASMPRLARHAVPPSTGSKVPGRALPQRGYRGHPLKALARPIGRRQHHRTAAGDPPGLRAGRHQSAG